MNYLLANVDASRVETGKHKGNRDQIELIVVVVGHQVFGLLMSQVINIVRPGPAGTQVLKPIGSQPDHSYGEILYRNSPLRVVELNRQLLLPLVETLERSKVLLTGRVQSDGSIKFPFGIAIDDIVTLRRVNLADLRLLPSWLCAAHFGKLIWSTALVEPEALSYDKTNLDYQTSALPKPFQVDEQPDGRQRGIFALETNANKGPDKNKQGLEVVPVVVSKTNLTLAERLSQRERKVEQLGADNRRPLLLLDLHLLEKVAYPEYA